MELSIIFQGSLSHLKTREQQSELVDNILHLKKNNPQCEILISTWEGEKISYLKSIVDKIIMSKDPGTLPGLKFDDKLNNVNRLIVSSQAGVTAAKGKIIVKLRSDLKFFLNDIVNFYRSEIDKYSSISPDTFGNKVICSNLFTLDPVFVERMPYHIGDWIQIGEAEDIKRMWNIPLYQRTDALHYNFNKFAKNSNYLEKQFQSKFAVEQYLTIEFAKNFGKKIGIRYHNDYKNGNIKDFYSFLTSNYIIKDMRSLRLINDKYRYFNNSLFYKAACISESRYNLIYNLCKNNNSWIRTDIYGFFIGLIGTTLTKLKKLKSRVKFVKSILTKI
ncbi:WavE lipopolysaccharide synthesis family protein [Pantoea stewartii]|uniref:WavE lipopolysaccharide synthesis family protein n=1 Tax=Pantoea stewartii TaxID=66269 RepID=UPI00197D2D01|nr:WavE lipopolysaccharide synthesis family protein [Pantoea stewartii]